MAHTGFNPSYRTLNKYLNNKDMNLFKKYDDDVCGLKANSKYHAEELERLRHLMFNEKAIHLLNEHCDINDIVTIRVEYGYESSVITGNLMQKPKTGTIVLKSNDLLAPLINYVTIEVMEVKDVTGLKIKV